ncbi:type VI secretion system baseplate subunit TssF [Acidicapsa dinghuensis]|uniref:Type VI secretion system baseplate subunit TssF n=1 Tax=Acidicapsa dinghuensis TaxID=2218256 RepID=A0ABW1EH78_9BACT|nr:type VI secretion system baseplate subunit TssF [Acidicapsa dinghuensis]
MRDEMLLFYERELDYMRKSAAQFAEKHPKVASRLVLEPTKCEDPHVERLLEAFAFLTARIHLKMEDEFPEITEALLTVIYPQLVRPLPSMSVVEFQLDPEKGKLASGLKIDRSTPLYSKPVQGMPCTFRTCYDTTLWPITVSAAELSAPSRLKPAVKTSDSAWAIRLELRCARDITFVGLQPDKLRFYLDGESGLVNILYELLFSRVNRILVRDLTEGSRLAPITLPTSALSAVGFGPDEGLFPYPSSSFAGHRLLLEYFAFPEKFFFIDLAGLDQAGAAGFKDALEVIFLISDVESDGRLQRLELELSKKTFRLGCSPVVNLFTQVAEPIQLNQRKYEYSIAPDVRRPYAMEVFSVDEVGAINSANQKITTYEPFYSLRHSARKEDRPCFWLARRRASNRPNDDGTDLYLSLVDLSMSTVHPDATVLSVRTTCTNRDLPSRLPFGNQDSDFEMEGAAAMRRIVALRKPTPTVRPALGKSTLWRLVSHLSINYLSLVEEGKTSLQEILRLYDVGRTAYSQNVIQSILNIRSSRHFTRLISPEGVSFARGIKIDLELDEDQFTGSGAFLFASVLDRFFGLCASLNSFTRLRVTTPQRKEALHEWEPRAGRKLLI